MLNIKNLISQTNVMVFALLVSILFNINQCSQNNRIIKQSPPELDLNYSFDADSNKLSLDIKNIGLVDCDKVWVEEKIYIIIDSMVYEGVDIPHFNYFVFNDSKDKLFELDKDDNHVLKIDNLQYLAISQLIERFHSKVFSHWKLTYISASTNKQFSTEKYFLHENLNQLPTELILTTGGFGLKERIENYRKHGVESKIKIFTLTNKFELNTPDVFLITKDAEIRSLDNKSNLSIEELREVHLILGSPQIQISNELKGTIRNVWSYDRVKNEWGENMEASNNWKFHTQPFKSLLGFLSLEDYKKVLNNKEEYSDILSLSLYFSKEEASKDEILLKAKENFLKNMKYR